MPVPWTDPTSAKLWLAAQLARIPPVALVAAERQADADHARWIVSQAATLIALIVILAAGAARWGRRFPPAPPASDGVAAFARIGGVLAIVFAARLVAGLAAAHVWPTAAPSAGTLIQDAAANLSFSLVLTSLIYAGLRAVGRWWPVPLVGLALALPLAVLVLAPAVVSPRLRHDRPAPPSAARQALLEFVHRGGEPVSAIYVYDNRDPTDCDVVGWGPGAHVAVSQALLAEPLRPESLAALGHVMAHARYRDLWSLALLTAVVWSVGGLAAGGAVIAFGPRLTGARRVADPAGLPLAMLVLTLTALTVRPAYNGLDQAVNYRADAYVMHLTRSADGLATWVTGRSPLVRPDPGPLEALLFYGHPPLTPRLAAMAQWRAAHPRP